MLGAASCVAPLDLSATRFSCDEAAPDCPAGFECVGARCVPADGGATDASGGTDAGPAPSCPATEGFVAVEPGQFVMGEEPWTPCVCAQPLNLASQPDHLVRITRP